MTLLAGSQIGKYVVQRKLAEGGMAEIFVASSFGPEGFEKQVIIKRIRAGLASDAAFIKMFVSEARLVSRLNHANIVQVFDFDRHEDTFYIAMEYVRGVSLAQAHTRARDLGQKVPSFVAAQVAMEVARGLSFAHRLTEHGEPLGIVHRDVTPQNILLSYEGAVKLTDFGIAKAGTRASTVGMLKGKFAYMSPEQSRGEAVDSRTDVFALGITVWELLTGQQLFDADSDIAVLRAVQDRDVAPPAQFNPEVDPALSAIVMRCLERERSARFQSAQELERALNRYAIAHAERSEEIELASWIRGLFPEEAAHVEPTINRQVPDAAGRSSWPGVAIGQAAGPAGIAAVVSSGSSPLPEGLFLQQSESAPRASPSGATPVLPAQRVWEEPPTRRTVRARWTRWLWALPIAAAASGVLVAGVFQLRKTTATQEPAERAATPATTLAQPVLPPPETAPAPTAPVPVVAAKPLSPTTSAAGPHKTGGAPHVTAVVPLGTLELTVGPFGEVFIDGKSRGEQVGSVRYPLPAGDHLVDIKGAVRWGPKRITILPGRVTAQSAWVE